MATPLTIGKVLETASLTEALSNNQIQVEIFIHETLAGGKYDRKLGRWYEDAALHLIHEYPEREGWKMRLERHPGYKWHLYPVQEEVTK